jgi:hypothetical protein
MIQGGAAEGLVFPINGCVVPKGLDGPGMSTCRIRRSADTNRSLCIVHIFVINSSTPLSSDIVIQDSSIIVAGEHFLLLKHPTWGKRLVIGPAVAFIDTVVNAESEVINIFLASVCANSYS